MGYIKMDYNIEPGIGTEYQAETVSETASCSMSAPISNGWTTSLPATRIW